MNKNKSSDSIERREAWIDESLRRSSKVRYTICALFIRILPKCFGAGSGFGFAALLVRYIFTFMIASTPFWLSYFDDPNAFDLRFAFLATAALATLMFISGVINLFWLANKSDKNIFRLRQSIAALEANLHSDIANITHPSKIIKNDKETLVLQNILSSMVDEARAHLKNFDETSMQATILLFSGESLETFSCRARARSNRPSGHTVRCIDSIACFWMKRFPDRASTVHDITKQRVFPQRLSDGPEASNYRSILSLPLARREDDSNVHLVRGVVTLDSKRRYEFWGARKQELEALLEPHMRWIMAITDDHPHTMRINGSA